MDIPSNTFKRAIAAGKPQIGDLNISIGSEQGLTDFLAALDDGVLTVAPAGRPYARTIAALFDPYRQDSLRRFSSAV